CLVQHRAGPAAPGDAAGPAGQEVVMHRLCRALVPALLLAVPPGAAHARAGKGKRYALLVGVKEYDHQALSNLKWTENDVVELGKLLRRGGYRGAPLCDSEGRPEEGRAPPPANTEAAPKGPRGGA